MEDRNGREILQPVPVKTLQQLMQITEHNTVDVLKIDISGEFEIFRQLATDGFDFRSKVGILLLEVHMWHPQDSEGLTANCCYGPSDLEWLLDMLKGHGFALVDYELEPVGGCCLEISWVNPLFLGG
jgi:hypothetical protein